MDGFKTYVLHYQDENGTIFTTRIISNNPNTDEDLHNVRLAELHQAWGYDLLSVQRVDELVHEVPAPISRLGPWYRNAYRAVLVLVAILVACDLALGLEERRQIGARLDRLEEMGHWLTSGRSPAAKDVTSDGILSKWR